MVKEIAYTTDLMRSGYGIDSVSENLSGRKAIEYKEDLDNLRYGGIKTETSVTLCSIQNDLEKILDITAGMAVRIN
jgi:hypothetical protein